MPALFLDMFGDPASNPTEWPMTTFGGSISVSSGTFLPAKNMDKSENEALITDFVKELDKDKIGDLPC